MSKVTVSPRMQAKGTSCWLSGLEMMYDWKYKRSTGFDYTTEILAKMDESTELYPYFMRENGIAPGECRETAKKLGLFPCGDTSKIGAQALEDVIAAHGPVWIAGRWYLDCDHVVVVTGCDATTDKITYINPWKNYSLEESPGTVGWLQTRGKEWSACDASIMYWM
ncbi:MAG: papain-like cysteine protease family protein [Acidobacteriota bacterium]